MAEWVNVSVGKENKQTKATELRLFCEVVVF